MLVGVSSALRIRDEAESEAVRDGISAYAAVTMMRQIVSILSDAATRYATSDGKYAESLRECYRVLAANPLRLGQRAGWILAEQYESGRSSFDELVAKSKWIPLAPLVFDPSLTAHAIDQCYLEAAEGASSTLEVRRRTVPGRPIRS